MDKIISKLKIKIDSASVLFPNIRTAPISSRRGPDQTPQRSTFQVFQVIESTMQSINCHRLRKEPLLT